MTNLVSFTTDDGIPVKIDLEERDGRAVYVASIRGVTSIETRVLQYQRPILERGKTFGGQIWIIGLTQKECVDFTWARLELQAAIDTRRAWAAGMINRIFWGVFV